MKTRKYSDKVIVMDEIRDDTKFIIPQYQRNVVWNKKKREAFLRNVLDGEPFGIILIRDHDNTYELIDGLQRISTIKDFDKTPYEYLNPTDINMKEVDDLIKAHLTSLGFPEDEEYIEEHHEEWRSKIFECLKDGLKEFQIMKRMQDSFELKNEDEINEIIYDICYKFKESIKLDGLKVMAINYTGPIENIPTVFYNLNTGGVQLSKYETYAALWYNPKYEVKDEELIEVVANKYTQLQNDSDLEVDFEETTLWDEGITLFEYCYALGGIMRNEGLIQLKDKKLQILFDKNKKSTDPTGFELLALLLTDKINKADQLHKLLEKVSPNFLVELKNTIKKSVKEVSEALAWLLDGMTHSALSSDSNYLIYHMIVSYIKEYYDIKPETQTIHKKVSSLPKEDFKKYAKYHYFYDCITDFWNNNRQVSDLEREITDEKRRQRYWYNIEMGDWEEAIQSFMDSQKTSRKRVLQKNKLFVDFLTKMKVNENPQYERYFTKDSLEKEEYCLDIEHIVPKKRIEDHINLLPESEQNVFPVSAVGNLCYLTSKDNRAKKHKTLYEYVKDSAAFSTKDDFMKCIIYPSEGELRFIYSNIDDFQKGYYNFINERQEKLKQEFLKLIIKY